MSDPIYDQFRTLATEAPDRLALWSRGESLRLTFHEMAERVERRHRVIADRDLGTVAVATGNCAAFVELFLALRKADRTMVTMDGTLTDSEAVRICQRLGVKALVRRGDPGSDAGADTRLLDVPETVAQRPPQDTALVKLTSGSTGEPVGACFSSQGLTVGIRQIAAGMGIERRHRVLIAIPLSHSYGFDNGVLSLAVVGTPLILEPSFFPAALIRAFVDSDAHFFFAVPPMIRALAESVWPQKLSLVRVVCAGGPLDQETAVRFHQASGLRVHQFYGSSETGGITFERDPGDPAADGTVGTPLPGVEVSLGEGKVVVRSQANLVARWGEDRTTGPQTVTTGDLAEWTEEGRLRITGRAAHILNVGGKKIAAARIEEELRALSGVRDAAVVGIEDPARGDRVVAFLVASEGPVDVSGLPSSWSPREIRLVDELPFTERGKLDRERLRKWARES